MTNNPYTIEKGEHYIPSLNALNRIYTQHPRFDPNAKLIYELLFDYYNPNYGYAYPTFQQLALDSGLGASTVKRKVAVLKELDLVEVTFSRKHGNNTYVVKKPVQTLDQLYAKFPEIEKQSRERLQKIELEDEKEKSRRKGTEPAEQVTDDLEAAAKWLS